MILIIELVVAISAITIFFIARRVCFYKKRFSKLEKDYSRLVTFYAKAIKRLELYEIVLTSKGCKDTISAAAEMDMQENDY